MLFLHPALDDIIDVLRASSDEGDKDEYDEKADGAGDSFVTWIFSAILTTGECRQSAFTRLEIRGSWDVLRVPESRPSGMD